MNDHDEKALLREAGALFNDHPRFSLRGDRSGTSYALAGRIEAYFRSDQTPQAAIAVARQRWSSS